MMTPTRRRILTLAGGALAGLRAVSGASCARAGEAIESHGLSAFGNLAYPADFPHFRYVNPSAPKGGTFSQIGPDRLYNQNFLTFNSLNTFILKGDAAQGMELTFATLMVRSGDEPDAMYGLAAEKVRRSADGLTYQFFIRPEAKFHDGSPLTAQDVAFSLNILKEQGHPLISQSLRDFAGAKPDDDARVTVSFAPNRARDVPLLVAGLPIFSRSYYATRPFDQSTLDIPLGSGAYQVGRFEPGRYIEYQRVKDWWGADLPVARGQNNFDTLRFEYYRDRDVGFEGFSAQSYLFREEFTSRFWATRYDFPAAKDGRVKRDEIPDDTPSGAQGWFINTRRQKLADPRVREALNNAFDFEWTDKTIMYGMYKRTVSVFQNSDMMAQGKPDADETALLDRFRGHLSDEVFGEPYTPPISDGSGEDRVLLRKAAQLLGDAGCTIQNGKRVQPNGQPFAIEFLIDEPSFEPHHMAFIRNLKTLGIDATLRIVDPVQYRARRDNFDFDITIDRFSFSSTPGDSLRSFFSSQAASLAGSNNLAGISDPVVDALIDAIVAANSRPALVTACRALDRVVRAGRYWVPNWYKASHWIAYWDLFGRPPAQPRYFRGIPDTWWYDPDKAAKIKLRG
ncbi:MAG TPA: extracellular solute-binding protein [Xanthobacteraceae bacterium]|nr:extracellular solute-binding protein [Xanthobacteraceae bacterium]